MAGWLRRALIRQQCHTFTQTVVPHMVHTFTHVDMDDNMLLISLADMACLLYQPATSE
jgi:hypothetical protein